MRNTATCASQYGATSTILTEYLEACGADVSQRLATALLYGIKSDTLMLNRETGPADLRAFMSLYPLTNYNTLRRIERPELPLAFAEFLARVLPRMRKQIGPADAARRNAGARGGHPAAGGFLPAVRGHRVGGGVRQVARGAGHVACATRATCAAPATWCASSSGAWAAPAGIARWPRRSCRCATGARRLGRPMTAPSPRPWKRSSCRSCTATPRAGVHHA